jgi:carbamoyl-phosphate synthase large subunit
MNILITSAGRRVSLVRAFQKEIVRFFSDGKIFTVDMQPELSSACTISDGYFAVPRVTDPSYCQAIVEICKKNDIKLIIPTIDTELITLAENADFFRSNGIEPVVSEIDEMVMCRDKRKILKYFDSIGLANIAEADLENPVFPIFAKPVNGSSSIGIRIIKDKTQLDDLLNQNGQMVFFDYLSPEDYVEFTIDMYFDKNSFLKCAVPRERLEVRSGEVSKSVTRKDDLYQLILSKFSHCPGFKGCITLQVFLNRITREVTGIEINPRFGGGFPLSYQAGANFPLYVIKEYLMNEQIEFFDGWANNLLMLRYDDEIIVHDYQS